MLPLLPGQQSGLKKVRKEILEGGWVLISTTGPNLGTHLIAGAGPDPYFRNRSVQSTLEDGHGGLPESPEYPKESSPPSFGIWEEERGGGEVLDRESGTVDMPRFKRPFSWLDCSFGLVFKQEGSAKQPLSDRPRVPVLIRAVTEANLRGEPHTESLIQG